MKYLCIAVMVLTQVIGTAIGYNNNPCFDGAVMGYYVSLGLLMIVALNIFFIGALAGKW